ncbi:MAG: CPBP family intramembrane metalloprotease [Bacteroidales bacterium]|nr:CPBP family intramembrane metalloprotease [Bacteroidales bacterium]
MSGIKEMPVWKWALLLLASLFLAVLLYGVGGIPQFIVPLWLRWTVEVLCAAAMLWLYSVFVKWFEKAPAKDLPLNRLAPHTGAGLLVGVVYFILIVAVMMAFGVYRITGTGSDFKGVADAFFMFLIVAVGEEILFRGVLFRWIDEKWGFVTALAVSALVFGFAHYSNDNSSLWAAVAIAIEAGLLLGAAYKWSGTLWLPIGIHWAWNFSQGNIFGFEVSGQDAGASLILSQVDGSEWLTGGAFGAEASVISVVAGAALAVRFILKTVRK